MLWKVRHTFRILVATQRGLKHFWPSKILPDKEREIWNIIKHLYLLLLAPFQLFMIK
jgi:hypothetical protein